jgi:hypothetical protein
VPSSSGVHYKSIHGWLLFDTPTKCEDAIRDEIQFRFYGETYSGERYDQTSQWFKVPPSGTVPLAEPSEGRTAGPMVFSPAGKETVDLSGFTPKFFASQRD